MGSSLHLLRNPAPRLQVALGDETFEVKGLGPADVLGLYYRHTGQLSDLFEQMAARYQGAGGQVSATDIQQFGMHLLGDAPRIMAELIALGTGGDPSDIVDWQTAVEVSNGLPFAVQVDALRKIGELTFSSDMPPGKFLALAVGGLKNLTAKLSPAA